MGGVKFEAPLDKVFFSDNWWEIFDALDSETVKKIAQKYPTKVDAVGETVDDLETFIETQFDKDFSMIITTARKDNRTLYRVELEFYGMDDDWNYFDHEDVGCAIASALGWLSKYASMVEKLASAYGWDALRKLVNLLPSTYDPAAHYIIENIAKVKEVIENLKADVKPCER